MCFIIGTDFSYADSVSGAKFHMGGQESFFYKFVSYPGGENETHTLTFMFQIFGGLERGKFLPPKRSYLENHFQFASFKFQLPWASHVLGNICFTIRRCLHRKPALLRLPFKRISDQLYFPYQMYLYNYSSEGILGEYLENM